MSITVFRNHDISAIKVLLKEIGKERYECALSDAGLSTNKPLSMHGFFVEYETDTSNIYLYYRYPSRAVFKIMSVLGFWSVPTEQWVRERKS
ncbi:hypothetical protein [Zobellia alginiliquefaciens]|uniref:hypothetical protein n=1 Tax=Zobellia alginiliquefaciens TaxID=3032586 RepID=UPI0023E3B8C7|nr:hypothetical protein [Zobellia alginiliquefaciens]